MSSRAATTIPAEPRGGTRYKVFLPAQMSGAQGASRVHLLNISATGALVHGEPLPKVGQIVQISCEASNWLARVVWAQHKRFGVVHVAPMSDAAVKGLVAGQAG